MDFFVWEARRSSKPLLRSFTMKSIEVRWSANSLMGVLQLLSSDGGQQVKVVVQRVSRKRVSWTNSPRFCAPASVSSFAEVEVASTSLFGSRALLRYYFCPYHSLSCGVLHTSTLLVCRLWSVRRATEWNRGQLAIVLPFRYFRVGHKCAGYWKRKNIERTNSKP